MDIITYGLLKGQINALSEKVDNITLAFAYKGSVDSIDDLPDDATIGDMYTVDGVQYAWDGEYWIIIKAGNIITNEQIDEIVV